MKGVRILLAFLALAIVPSLQAQSKTESAAGPFEPATLSVWNREIVEFRATLGTLTPEARRDLVQRRLSSVPDFDLYHKVRMESVELGALKGYSFSVGESFLFTLTEQDLDPDGGQSLENAAEEIVERLEDLRVAKLEQRNWMVILRGLVFILLATAVFSVILWGLSKAGRMARRFFVRWIAHVRDLKSESYDLRPLLLQIFRRLVSLIGWALALFACYLWLVFCLAQFPYTAPWASQLGKHVVRIGEQMATATLSAVPGLITVVVIFALTRGAARIVDQLLRGLENSQDQERAMPKDTARATRRIATTLIWVFGVVLAYPYIPGSGSDAFKGVTVLFGLMISLGSTGFVNQIMSGFVILYSGAVRSGEYVQAGNVEGTVTEIGLLSTKVVTPKNEFIAIPNAVIVSNEVTNYSRMEKETRTELFTNVTIGYDAPWKLVHEMLLEAADRTPGIREKPEPRILQKALSDFYVEYELRFVPADIRRKGIVLSDLHQRIQDVFHENGVQIMSPHFVTQPEEPVLPVKEDKASG